MVKELSSSAGRKGKRQIQEAPESLGSLSSAYGKREKRRRAGWMRSFQNENKFRICSWGWFAEVEWGDKPWTEGYSDRTGRGWVMDVEVLQSGGRGDGCEGVMTGSVNDKENMIVSVEDHLLGGQPCACRSEYLSKGNTAGR